MGPLHLVVAAGPPALLESAIFGTTESRVVAAALEETAVAATGHRVAEGLWYGASVAAVAAVRLDDGRDVVVRALQADVAESFIAEVVRLERELAARRFACPVPIGEPVRVGSVLGRVETLLPDPGARRPTRHEMTASANGLATLVRLAAGLDAGSLASTPIRVADGELYGTPHSPVFDFEATAEPRSTDRTRA